MFPSCPRFALFPALALCLTGCSPAPFHPSTPASAQDASPLGPSYVLLPLPGDDESLLGRVLPEMPQPGRSLEETSRPNPCAEALTPPKPSTLASTFEDAQDVSSQAQAKAMLGVFGFSGDVARASHFVYKIATDKRVALTDTNAYVACCEQKGGCGVGFVSALVHGEGEYATGEESGASGSVTVPMAGAGGGVQLKVLHRRNVRGYLAALITVTSKDRAGAALGPLGVAAMEPTISQRVQEVYERDKMRIVDVGGGEWVLATGTGMLTENEFVRRYESVTGSSELRPAATRKNWGTVITLGVLSAGSLYLTYWGATHLKTDCDTGEASCWHPTDTGTTKVPPAGTTCVGSDCSEYVDPTEKRSNVGGILALTGGGVLSLAILPLFVYALVDGDGMPASHALGEDDARRYVTRYNRTMLRHANEKVRRELQIEQGAGLWLSPVVGPGTAGFSVRF